MLVRVTNTILVNNDEIRSISIKKRKNKCKLVLNLINEDIFITDEFNFSKKERFLSMFACLAHEAVIIKEIEHSKNIKFSFESYYEEYLLDISSEASKIKIKRLSDLNKIFDKYLVKLDKKLDEVLKTGEEDIQRC
jgi:hypothetical protein